MFEGTQSVLDAPLTSLGLSRTDDSQASMFVFCGVDSSRGVEVAEGILDVGERICRVTVESQTAWCGCVVDSR